MGLFFKRKKLEDLSFLNTDIHSHLIPGIDDGATNIEESINLIGQMYELGYRKLVITPHVRYESFDNDPTTFDDRLSLLQTSLQEANIPIKTEIGAEHTIDDGFFTHLKNDTLKHFGKNKYLLIEFSFLNMLADIKDVVFKLQSSGYNLILAHPERYLYLTQEREMINYLHDAGVLFQMNILSLVGFYNKDTQRFAEDLIKDDKIDIVGSDLHHQKHLDAIKEALTNKMFIKLVESGRLMNNRF